MEFFEDHGIQVPRWMANEQMRDTDVNFIHQASYLNHTSLLATLAEEGVASSTHKAVILGGMLLEWDNLLTCYLRAGMALSYTGRYYTGSLWSFSASPGEVFSVTVMKDQAVAFDSGDASDRYDLLEVRPIRTEYDSALRAFKDPITGVITTTSMNTKVAYEYEFQIKKGTPGSGFAPTRTAGWIKVAEVRIPALAAAITQNEIKDVRASDTWTTEISDTVYKAVSHNAKDYADGLIDTDELLGSGSPSDVKVASQKAVKTFVDRRVQVGDIKFNEGLINTSASFPWFCLAKNAVDLSDANYPDFVPYRRGMPLRYDPLNTNKTAFDVTDWVTLAGTATLTFANAAPENALLASLAEDYLVHGSYVNWKTVTLAAAIGNIPAGDYAITNVNTGTRQISFLAAVPDGGAAGAWTVEFYPYRISGSTTTCRHFAVQGRGFITVMDSGNEWIGGLRRRDRGQGHRHPVLPAVNYLAETWTQIWQPVAGIAWYDNRAPYAGDPSTDGVNGTPRTGQTTDIRGQAAYPYVFVGRYIP